MADKKDSSLVFFSKATSNQWSYVLSLYSEVLKVRAQQTRGTKKGGPQELIKLDNWLVNFLFLFINHFFLSFFLLLFFSFTYTFTLLYKSLLLLLYFAAFRKGQFENRTLLAPHTR